MLACNTIELHPAVFTSLHIHWFTLFFFCICFSDKESQCELVDRLMQVVMREDFVQEDASNLAACLCHILRNHFISSILPQEIDDE
jgi:hypothetical protein